MEVDKLAEFFFIHGPKVISNENMDFDDPKEFDDPKSLMIQK